MALPSLKLISHKLCPYVQRARIVVAEKSIPHEIEFIDLGNKPQWFLDVSPLGKTPVLLADGEAIFESAVIVEYLDEITEGSLHPRSSLHKARNRAWIEIASNTLNIIANLYNARDERAFAAVTETLVRRFGFLERVLDKGPYFNGEHFSLVDAAFAPVFRYFEVMERYGEFGFFANTPKVNGWREALRRRPSVRNAVVEDFPERLEQFFLKRRSFLAGVIRERLAA